MPKIDVNKVAEILKKNHIDPAVLRRVVEEMNLAVQPDPGEGDLPPPVKKQFVILVSDPRGRCPSPTWRAGSCRLPRARAPPRPRSGSQGRVRLQRLKEGAAPSRRDGRRRARERAGQGLQGRRALGEDEDARGRP